MSNFTFDAVKHTYTLDGELLPGVTTVLNTLSKPALIPWASKMAVEYIKDNCEIEPEHGMYLVSIDDLRDAQNAHAQKRDKAADSGTDVHEMIEMLIKSAIEKGGTLQTLESQVPQVQKFLDWAITNKVQFHESEKKLYSPTHKFAGTVDFTCTMDGKRLVGDIKTTSGIYDLSPFLQVAAYRICLEEMGESPYHGGVIIRLGKNGDFEEAYRYDTGDDMEAFLALLKVYKALAKYKNQK